MTALSDDELAAGWVTGTLTEAEADRVRERIRAEPGFRALVEAIETSLAPLALATAPVEPSPSLRARIEAAIDALPPPVPGAVTVRRDDGAWETWAPGVAIKLLAIDPERRRRTLLLRIDKGATLPAHHHRETEEAYILEGDLILEGVTLVAGDFQIMPKGTLHKPAFSPSGCLALVSTGL
jgi:anti-sigma factor ChrR (cupin superfamily)